MAKVKIKFDHIPDREPNEEPATERQLDFLRHLATLDESDLLDDLATLTRNTIVSEVAGAGGWPQDAVPTPLQAKILELLTNHPMP